MATSIIDAFLVTLGLDGSAYNKGVTGAEKRQDDLTRNIQRNDTERNKADKKLAAEQDKRAKEELKRNKGSSEAYKGIKRDILALAAVFTAGVGIKNFITDTINSAVNVGYLSKNLGISTERLISWQRASERAGGTAEGVVAQLKESADALAQLNSGMGPNEGMQWFFRMGGSTKDLKDGNTYLLARSKIVADLYQTDPTRAALIARQMGISDDQFNFLKQGPEAVQAMVDAQEKNAAVTAKNAEEALKLRNKVLDLRDSLQSTATRILLRLAPSLERLFARLEQGAQWVSDHKEDIARWVDTSIAAVTKFVKTADDLAQAVGGWKNVLLGLGAVKVVGTAAGIAGVAASVAGLGTAVAGAVAAGAGIPGLLVGLAGMAAYAGYKGAEFLSNFGKDKAAEPVEAPQPRVRLKSELRTEANRQRVEAGLPALPERVNVDTKEDLRAEANRQRMAAGLPRLPPVAPRVGNGEAPPPQPSKRIGGPVLPRNELAVGNGEPPPPPKKPPPQIAQDVVSKLEAMGWTREQAAGITASFVQESDLDPGATNPKSGMYGIGQWSKARREDFREWAGKSIYGSSLDDQLAFFNHEVTKGKEDRAGALLRASRSAEEAARVHSDAYERPGKGEADIPRRQRMARDIEDSAKQTRAAAVMSIPVGAPAAAPVTNNSTRATNTSTTEVKIAAVNINTQATDAAGIAREITPAIERYGFTVQANSGVS